MSYGPSEGPLPVKNRHRWEFHAFAWEKCADCGFRRDTMDTKRWRDHYGEEHYGNMPRCGESTWGRP